MFSLAYEHHHGCNVCQICRKDPFLTAFVASWMDAVEVVSNADVGFLTIDGFLKVTRR